MNPMKKRKMPGSTSCGLNPGPGKQVRKEARKNRTCWSRQGWGWEERGRDLGTRCAGSIWKNAKGSEETSL